MKLREVLTNPETFSSSFCLYLPGNEQWQLNSDALVMEEEDVSEEEEDADPDAAIPSAARSRGMIRALDIASIQDVVANAREQRPRASDDELFRAFLYYFDHDAFLHF